MMSQDEQNKPTIEKVFKEFLESIKPGADPRMFQCMHCGGFHSFDIDCKSCGGVNKAQQAVVFGAANRMLAGACCEQCLALSVAIFKCHGIDPEKKDLQHQYAENAKAQARVEEDCKILEFKKE
jgi:hypothetical protein